MNIFNLPINYHHCEQLKAFNIFDFSQFSQKNKVSRAKGHYPTQKPTHYIAQVINACEC